MKILYALAIASVLLESQNNWLFWPVIPVLLSAMWVPPERAYLLAFALGLITDIFIAKPLGLSSLILLLFSACFFFLKSHFQSGPRIAFVLFLISQIVLKLVNF